MLYPITINGDDINFREIYGFLNTQMDIPLIDNKYSYTLSDEDTNILLGDEKEEKMLVYQKIIKSVNCKDPVLDIYAKLAAITRILIEIYIRKPYRSNKNPEAQLAGWLTEAADILHEINPKNQKIYIPKVLVINPVIIAILVFLVFACVVVGLFYILATQFNNNG